MAVFTLVTASALSGDQVRAHVPCPAPVSFQQQSLSPAILPQPETWQAKTSTLRELAQHLHQQESQHRVQPETGMDSVDAMQALIEKAATLTADDPEQFIKLMNEVVIGDSQNAFFIPKRHLNEKRIPFGDLGMNPIYQDGSPVQMYHFWAYVNFGFDHSHAFTRWANRIHEIGEPGLRGALKHIGIKAGSLSRDPSEEDYRLSFVGEAVGCALKDGSLTPETLAGLLDSILRTDEANRVKDNSWWLKLLPEAPKRHSSGS